MYNRGKILGNTQAEQAVETVRRGKANRMTNSPSTGAPAVDVKESQRILFNIRNEVGKIIIGQNEAIDQAIITILAGRHALIEGVPGVAKTLLVRTLARLLGAPFQRIQFSVDTTPTSIIGANVFNPASGTFTLVHGPIFTTFLLADEINRAPGITQAALLQAMQERCVTIDRTTHALSPNFTVFATQNPVESEGTFPLPEAQEDRFLLKIHMDYPTEEEEYILAVKTLSQDAPETLLEEDRVQNVLTENRLAVLRDFLQTITVPEAVIRYGAALVRFSRIHSSVKVGAGPRATQALLLASRARAALYLRDSVTPEDVQAMAPPCLGHRLILKPEHVEKGLSPAEVVAHILSSVPFRER